MEISINDIVQVKRNADYFYAKVVDIIPANHVRPAQYRVKSLADTVLPTLTPNPGELWVDSTDVVSYAALRAVFGGIDSVEDILNASK